VVEAEEVEVVVFSVDTAVDLLEVRMVAIRAARKEVRAAGS
jgi:hypothetical protein